MAAGTQYTCPMHPEIVRDKPGSCPICGMALSALSRSIAAVEMVMASGRTHTQAFEPTSANKMPFRGKSVSTISHCMTTSVKIFE